MKGFIRTTAGGAVWLCSLLATAQPIALSAQQAAGMPQLVRNGDAVQLMVDGAPFLVLGGELHNSSSSSLAYMKDIWPRLVRLNLNTVLAPVSWAQLEPNEGKFDFALVDGLIQEARRNNLHLVLLWFGSWKNGLSHYAPAWVKRDYRRFPRALLSTGTPEVLSTLSEANREADAHAFAALMRHVRETDADRHTVIMVQVENEVGLLGDSRDRSAAADAAFSGQVPNELMDYLDANRADLAPNIQSLLGASGRSSGTWREVFGDGNQADEIFMAWNYARYINDVVEAGKAEYPLPMYVNAWIVQPQDTKPGDYPSGGPQAHVHDIWKAGAPAVDILAPDIYLPDFPGITAEYGRSGTPLFVPESTGGQPGAANAFFAIGQRNAIGYSPFGIESLSSDSADGDGPLARAYDVLAQLAPVITKHQADGTIAGVWLDSDTARRNIPFGDYYLSVSPRVSRRSSAPFQRGYAIIIATGPDEYLIAGSNAQVTFTPNSPGPKTVGLATVEEGTFVNAEWVPGRRLNGDEVMTSYDMAAEVLNHQTGTGLRFGSDPSIIKVELYRFQ